MADPAILHPLKNTVPALTRSGTVGWPDPKFGTRRVLRIMVEARISLVILTDEAKVDAVGLIIVTVPVLIP